MTKTMVFRVSLALPPRPIWRRFELPTSSTFADLHVAIQTAFGWSESHAWGFYAPGGRSPLADSDVADTPLSSWFSGKVRICSYIYDFGDNWTHVVELEERRSSDEPHALLGGERACPPEDCGGAPGYKRCLALRRLQRRCQDPEEDDEYHAVFLEDWSPEAFDLAAASKHFHYAFAAADPANVDDNVVSDLFDVLAVADISGLTRTQLAKIMRQRWHSHDGRSLSRTDIDQALSAIPGVAPAGRPSLPPSVAEPRCRELLRSGAHEALSTQILDVEPVHTGHSYAPYNTNVAPRALRHADLLFEVVSRRYAVNKPVIITTNKPFAEWGETFPNATCVVTLVDRLVHRSEIVVLAGKSFRLKESKEQSEARRKAREKRKS